MGSNSQSSSYLCLLSQHSCLGINLCSCVCFLLSWPYQVLLNILTCIHSILGFIYVWSHIPAILSHPLALLLNSPLKRLFLLSFLFFLGLFVNPLHLTGIAKICMGEQHLFSKSWLQETARAAWGPHPFLMECKGTKPCEALL